MEQETELNIHKKKKKALLCSMDVDNCLDFSHKSTRLSTMEIYEADATRNINSFLTAVNLLKRLTTVGVCAILTGRYISKSNDEKSNLGKVLQRSFRSELKDSRG